MADQPRHPKGTPDGGKFAETGRAKSRQVLTESAPDEFDIDEKDAAIAYLMRDGNLLVPASRYGRDTETCAQVAWEVASVVASETGSPITKESLDDDMSMVVNDSSEVEELLSDYDPKWESTSYEDSDDPEPPSLDSNRRYRGHEFLPKRLSKCIPGLYATENVPLRDKPLHARFFAGRADWYIAEYDPQTGEAFGYADLGLGYPEWGYIDMAELESSRGSWGLVERDRDWDTTPAGAIMDKHEERR